MSACLFSIKEIKGECAVRVFFDEYKYLIVGHTGKTLATWPGNTDWTKIVEVFNYYVTSKPNNGR